MKTQAEFRADFISDVGDLGTVTPALFVNTDIDRWVNEGRSRIPFHEKKSATLTWSAGDVEVDLPSDLLTMSTLRGRDVCYLGHYVRWGFKLLLDAEEGASSAGTATLLYRSYYPEITDVAASTLPEEGDQALLSYAKYRFYSRLTGNRAFYKRYATLAGANAVQIEDLQAEASRHYDDFLAASEVLPPDEPAFFYNER